MLGVSKSIQKNALMPSCEPHKEPYGPTIVDHDASILKRGGTYLGTGTPIDDDTYDWSYLTGADIGPIYNAEDTDASLGSGLSMDGTGDYMNIDPVNLGVNCTISYWHKRHTDEVYPGYLEIPIGNTAESAVGGYGIYVIPGRGDVPSYTDGTLWVRGSGVGVKFEFGTELYDAMIGQWGHIAIVRSTIGSLTTGTRFDLYINGVPVDSPQTEMLFDGLDFLVDRIGAGTSGSYDVEGHMDDVALFNIRKSPTEILAMYNEGVPFDLTDKNHSKAPNYRSTGLVNYWRFNADPNTPFIIQDSVGGNDGTLQGNAELGQGAGIYSRNLNIVCNSNQQCGKWSLKDTADLSENLVTGEDYRILVFVKANWTDSNMTVRLWLGSSIYLTADLEGSTNNADGKEWTTAEDVGKWKWMGAKFTKPAGSVHMNLEAVSPYDPSHVFSFGKLYVGRKL